MKTLILPFALLLSAIAFSQQTFKSYQISNENLISSQNSAPKESVFTVVEFEKAECIPNLQRQEMDAEIKENRTKILERNPNAFKNINRLTAFVNPFRAKAGFSDYGFHTLQYLVDHNFTPNNQLRDYNCATRTYDWASGNHQGTDYILWPYPWKRMQENMMEVLAAAPGVIINKRDGFNDLNCSNNGNPNWNGIVLEHSDGSTTTYMHFKNNTATAKNIGDSVEAGELLGVAGSSGSSTIPHLHFEVRNSEGAVIDPYQGTCNLMNAESWWQTQETYYVPRINRISTHSTTTQDSACPVVENTYEKTNFATGDEFVIKVFYRDIQVNDLTSVRINRPDGTFNSWSWNQNWGAFYPTAYAYLNFNITDTWPTGIYNIIVQFKGNTYTTAFGVRTALSTQDLEQNTFRIYPNPAKDHLFVENAKNIEQAEIYDLSGRKLGNYSTEIKSGNINISKLSKGNYILKILTKQNKNLSLQFIKK